VNTTDLRADSRTGNMAEQIQIGLLRWT